MARYISYWLVPSIAPRTFLQECIATLAQTHQAPVFVPHVTIYSGESPPQEDPSEVITRSLKGVRPVSLQIQGILYSGVFTKTLFVQFGPSDVLSRLCEQIRRASARPSPYGLDPHLSLLYKHMGNLDKEAIIANLQLPMSTVLFDAVWAIAADRIPNTAEDVLGWKVVCARNLSEAL
jgi:hypothetical protein